MHLARRLFAVKNGRVTAKRLQNKLKKTTSIIRLRGIEGAFARQYFALFREHFSPEWQFTHRVKRPPKDPVNVLLSLGYTVLFNNIYTLLKARGLQANLGYLHNNYDKQPSLALDLMEPFRAFIVDSTVFDLISRGILVPAYFRYEGDACLLNATGRRIFIQALEDKFQRQITHPVSKAVMDYRLLLDEQVKQYKNMLSCKTPLEVFKGR